MLTEALIAIAASGGTAVVQAAGSDAWTSFRHGLATLMGRGDEQRTGTELERLDRTATAIVNASPEQAERVRILQEGTWQTRLEDWLESASSAEREHATEELRGIIAAVMEKRESGSTFRGDVRQDAKASGNARVYQLGQGEMRVSD